ncbi:MAG TPA: hypothetical protein VNM39_16860 [Verrucomicrobiae bacterium]|jgi:hypothetical protein|nr:hypothetical protein [Verrucomicrobiae bacterium]
MAEPPQGPGDAEARVDWKRVRTRALATLYPRMGGFHVDDIEDAAQKVSQECLQFVRQNGTPRSIDAVVCVIAQRIAADEIKRRVRERKALGNGEVGPTLHPPQDTDLYEAIDTTVFLIRGYYLLRHALCVEQLDARLQGVTFESQARSRGVTPTLLRKRWERCMDKVREAVRRGRLRIPLEFPHSGSRR